ncbi:hypothetical protein PENFLA_c101G09113, partial [Penicillium flavigenum]
PLDKRGCSLRNEATTCGYTPPLAETGSQSKQYHGTLGGDGEHGCRWPHKAAIPAEA